MRRLGIVLMTLGLIGALVALAFGETGSAALDAQERSLLDWAFYVSLGTCLLGAGMFSARVFIAKARREPGYRR